MSISFIYQFYFQCVEKVKVVDYEVVIFVGSDDVEFVYVYGVFYIDSDDCYVGDVVECYGCLNCF